MCHKGGGQGVHHLQLCPQDVPQGRGTGGSSFATLSTRCATREGDREGGSLFATLSTTCATMEGDREGGILSSNFFHNMSHNGGGQGGP